ncbi:MAG: hypothetical protein R3B49_03280 [Phycisphaerales bacterium]
MSTLFCPAMVAPRSAALRVAAVTPEGVGTLAAVMAMDCHAPTSDPPA